MFGSIVLVGIFLHIIFPRKVSNHYFVHVGHLPGEEHRRVHHVAIRGTVSFADLSIDLKTKQVSSKLLAP